MRIEFDATKDAINRSKHGVSLAAASRLDFAAVLVRADRRFDYGEDRFQALGPIDGRLYVLAYTMRGDMMRVISLRTANFRERTIYERS